jgi:hypothetical protein
MNLYYFHANDAQKTANIVILAENINEAHKFFMEVITKQNREDLIPAFNLLNIEKSISGVIYNNVEKK